MKLLGIDLIHDESYFRLNTIYKELNNLFLIAKGNRLYIYRNNKFGLTNVLTNVIVSNNELVILKYLYLNLKENDNPIELKQFEEVFAKELMFL